MSNKTTERESAIPMAVQWEPVSAGTPTANWQGANARSVRLRPTPLPLTNSHDDSFPSCAVNYPAERAERSD